MTNDEIKAMVKARDAALLSMDEQRLRAYFRKYNGTEMSADPEVFWRAIHKARTAATNLPMAARIASKKWLLARGSRSMDDGDVPT